MENEVVKIFNNNRQQIGVATRKEVHEKGYWHETFHCWFIKSEKSELNLFLQLRSDRKKDYPNLLDITAAGHILASETVFDGVREIKEELGITVAIEELLSLGIIDYSVTRKDLIDKEIAHVFLFNSYHSFEDFNLQKDEVAGVVKVKLNEFEQLWAGKKNKIHTIGFKQEENGIKSIIDMDVGKESFVPHDDEFYRTVIMRIKKAIMNSSIEI